jgi:hypothetical protein
MRNTITFTDGSYKFTITLTDTCLINEVKNHTLHANFSFVVQQIRHKFKIQKVDKMEEKRQRYSYLSFHVK